MSSKLPINLHDLLRQRTVEGERIEYKAGWNPDAIIRTLCAFANDFENLGGGYIVIGQDCDDAGRPVFPPKGLDAGQIDRIQRELLQHCNLIQPPYFPMLSLERFEARSLIVLWAPGGETRPYKAPRAVTAKKKEYHYFIRRYASTIEAKDEDERELISLTATVPFDDRYNQNARVDDISTRLMVDFLREVGSALADKAVDLSAEALGRQMNVVSGPLERPLPKNVGLLFGPDRSIKMDDLRVGRAVSRRYRNRRVGEFLKELDLTEGRSTGISKILNVMAANGSPPPEFETDEDRSYFLVRLPVHERAAVTQAGDRATPQVGTKLALSRHQVEILEKCRESTALVDLMVIADRSDRTKFRRQGLTPLIEAGLLEMTIPDKPTSSNQRYRLTDAGQRWLSQHRGSP